MNFLKKSSKPQFISPIQGSEQPRPPVKKFSSISSNNYVRSPALVLEILQNSNLEDQNLQEDQTIDNNLPETSNDVNTRENVKTLQNNGDIVYNIVWGKKSTKKHKTWQGDGILTINKSSTVLKDADGSILGKTSTSKMNFEECEIFSIGGKEVQIIELLTKPLESKNVEKTIIKQPQKRKSNLHAPVNKRQKISLHVECDPLVMPTPSPDHQWIYNKNKDPVVEVNVDYCLVKCLRPHQREGVIFLYKCILGFYNSTETNYYGAILADEMGLGKTLQCITLIWTLLKKGPYGNRPILQKVLVVTPSSLVENWQKEFQKWLSNSSLKTISINSKIKLHDLNKYGNVSVVFISYEMLTRNVEEIKELNFDLLICDEGHRLKNSQIKISTSLAQLDINRRIILTGTPIQNDLNEFYSLIDFVNPGILGTQYEYRKYYEEPIKMSREPNVDEDVKQLGEQRAKELKQKTNHFILRRTQEINNKYLPSKHEMVVFCRINDFQKQLYKIVVDFWFKKDDYEILNIKNDIGHLSVITALKKICNQPSLVFTEKENLSEEMLLLQQHLTRHEFSTGLCDSTKMLIVKDILNNCESTTEKIVLVSYSTKILDIFSEICKQNNYKHCRLDGSTPNNQRLDIVHSFNSANSNIFVFLLSAKAGGIGLNLTGASRLILYDSDWNPATDLQAMARIWRDGQQNKNVYIYRLLTSGTIEEKIFQRQISKTGLSGAVVDPENSSKSMRLSDEELKDLFTLNENSETCLTHELLNCGCQSDGSNVNTKLVEINNDDDRECQLGYKADEQTTANLSMCNLNEWEHYGSPINDTFLQEIAIQNSGYINYIFRNKTN